MTNQEILEVLKERGIELISKENKFCGDYQRCRTNISWFSRGLISLSNSLKLSEQQASLSQRIYQRIEEIHFAYIEDSNPDGWICDDEKICWTGMQQEFQSLNLADFDAEN